MWGGNRHGRGVEDLSPGENELYWSATSVNAHARTEIRLFADNPGYASSRPTKALENGAEYIVEINGVEGGTSLIPDELTAGKGAWLGDVFNAVDSSKERKKVTYLLCSA